MKKCFVTLCLILAVLLCACTSADLGDHTQTPLPSISPEDLIGKTLEEAEAILVTDRNLLAYGHGFASDKAGNPVYYTWDLDENHQIVITGADIFAAQDTDNSPASFEQLHEGMTITEVVAKIGLPTGIPATGLFYISFTDSQGKEHRIAWNGDPLVISWIPEQESEA